MFTLAVAIKRLLKRREGLSGAVAVVNLDLTVDIFVLILVFLLSYPEKIDWSYLSMNLNAMHLLERLHW